MDRSQLTGQFTGLKRIKVSSKKEKEKEKHGSSVNATRIELVLILCMCFERLVGTRHQDVDIGGLCGMMF